MKIEQIFNINRFILLYKQEFHLQLKQILFVIGAAFAVIALIHSFNLVNNFNDLNRISGTNYHPPFFISLFILGGIIVNGMSFNSFRTKSKTINYLMLPASSFEKFLYEFINKIILYIVFFPIIYWAATNLVSSIFHLINEDFIDYLFHFEMIFTYDLELQNILLILSIGLFLFTLPFTGATIFEKKPLIKVIIFSFIIGLLYFGFVYFTVEGFELYKYSVKKVLFFENKEQAKVAVFIVAIIAHFTLLTISFFKIKEKEV